MEIIFFISLPAWSFFHAYCLARTSFIGTHVFWGENLSSATSTVQGKCIYKIFKAENQKTQFPLFCTKPNIDKHRFSSFQAWSSQGRFISHPWNNSRIEQVDLPAIHGKYRSFFGIDLSANRSQRVKSVCCALIKCSDHVCSNIYWKSCVYEHLGYILVYTI